MRGMLLIVLAACSVPEVDYVPIERQLVVETRAELGLDVLFVVDDSPSMLDKQMNLITNFPKFVTRLSLLPGGLPDLHLGVVSTDMGTSGSGPKPPAPQIGQVGQGGCMGTGKDGTLTVGSAPVTGRFLSDTKNADGSRLKNYNGTLAAAFAQMAQLGAAGCGFEQTLRAMHRALDTNPMNAGFLRRDALLAIVFLTDEDDCSVADPALFGNDASLGPLQSFRCTRFGVTCTTNGATPDAMNTVGVKGGCTGTGSMLMAELTGFHDFLVGLKDDPRNVVVGGIMGDPDHVEVELRAAGGTPSPAIAHSCSYQNGGGNPEVADPGVRLKAFFDLFPERAAYTTICKPDLSDGLDQIGQLIVRAAGSPCVEAALFDVDPDQPGPQVDCVVEDVVGAQSTPIAACGPVPSSPCWRIEPDTINCPSSDHLKLVVDRAAAPAPGTVTKMRCRLR
jgi:hypothetical protein